MFYSVLREQEWKYNVKLRHKIADNATFSNIV